MFRELTAFGLELHGNFPEAKHNGCHCTYIWICKEKHLLEMFEPHYC